MDKIIDFRDYQLKKSIIYNEGNNKINPITGEIYQPLGFGECETNRKKLSDNLYIGEKYKQIPKLSNYLLLNLSLAKKEEFSNSDYTSSAFNNTRELYYKLAQKFDSINISVDLVNSQAGLETEIITLKQDLEKKNAKDKEYLSIAFKLK